MRWNASKRNVPVPQAKSSTVTRLLSARPSRNPEALFQNIVHRTHDEIHDRRRRVIDASALARGRIVGLQIVFIEIDEGVALEQPMLFFVGRAHLAADRLAVPKRQVLMDCRQIQSLTMDSTSSTTQRTSRYSGFSSSVRKSTNSRMSRNDPGTYSRALCSVIGFESELSRARNRP